MSTKRGLPSLRCFGVRRSLPVVGYRRRSTDYSPRVYAAVKWAKRRVQRDQERRQRRSPRGARHSVEADKPALPSVRRTATRQNRHHGTSPHSNPHQRSHRNALHKQRLPCVNSHTRQCRRPADEPCVAEFDSFAAFLNTPPLRFSGNRLLRSVVLPVKVPLAGHSSTTRYGARATQFGLPEWRHQLWPNASRFIEASNILWLCRLASPCR